MATPDVVKRVAELAQGRNVQVTGADGRAYRLVALGKGDEGYEQTQAKAAARLQDLDAQLRTTAAIVSAFAIKVEQIVKQVDEALGRVNVAAEGQARFAESADRLAEALRMDLEPVYNDNGKLVGARRVAKLKEG